MLNIEGIFLEKNFNIMKKVALEKCLQETREADKNRWFER